MHVRTPKVSFEDSTPPNKASVDEKIQEYRKLRREKFLTKYAKGRGAKGHYLLFEGELFDVKAIWAAAYQPSVEPSSFHTAKAVKGLQFLEFTCINEEGKLLFKEGKRSYKEASFLARNQEIVAAAKQKYELRCAVCDFDFGTFYGSLGQGYIECHHLHPLASGDGQGTLTSVKDLTVLCANCHRMAHRRQPPLTVEELKSAMAAARATSRQVVTTN